MEQNRTSILQMARGAIQERVDYEVTKAVGTTLGIAANPETGEMVLVESTPQVPGQMGLDGTVQAPPKILKVAQMN